MRLSILDMVADVRRAIHKQYISGAIDWADQERNGAWTAAVDEFDNNITHAIVWHDSQLARDVSGKLKRVCLGLLEEYRASKTLKQIEALFAVGPDPEQISFENWLT